MSTTLVLLVFLGIFWLEGIPLIRQKHTREAVIFAVLWTAALAYALPVTLGIPVPNPVRAIDALFAPLMVRLQ